MRMSQLFGRTLREPPADVVRPGLRLAVRAGLLRPVGDGRLAWLPLGAAVLRRMEGLLREAAEGVSGQELRLPPTVWGERGGGIEIMVDLSRREVRSYRDLPRLLYALGSRETGAPQGGWRLREVHRLEGLVLSPEHAGPAPLGARFQEALRGVFARCGLEPVEAEAGEGALSFLFPHPAGEEELVRCRACGYAAIGEVARFQLHPVPPQPLAEVCSISTPDCPTIADVAAFVGVPTEQTLKAVFYAWEQKGQAELVFVVVRGDLGVSEAKLLRLLGGGKLRAATDAEIRAAGAEPGYASPVGLRVRADLEREGVLVVGDRSIQAGVNFVAGANREGYHLTGVNYPRDFIVTLMADVARAREGFPCPECGEPLAAEPAVELARLHHLAGRFAGVTYLDAEGRERLVVVEEASIGVDQLVAAVVEAHHDEDGLVWPPDVAPYHVYLVLLGRQERVRQAAESAYVRLQEAGFSVLYDDRNESAGVKFTDADLIGCPVRITVSRRSMEAGGAEVKARWEGERRAVSLEGLPKLVALLLDRWPGL